MVTNPTSQQQEWGSVAQRLSDGRLATLTEIRASSFCDPEELTLAPTDTCELDLELDHELDGT